MKVTIAPDFRDLFRPLTDDEFKQVQANNLDDPDHERVPPIVVWDGLIIDGHHTYKIRSNLRINGKPVKIRYHKMWFADRDDAMAYAIRAQLGRRNLTPSQIAMALAKLPKLSRGGNHQPDQSANLQDGEFPEKSAHFQADRGTIAEEHGVSERTLRTADAVHEHGAKVIQDAVTAGDISVSDAASVIDLPKSEQAAALKKVKSGKAKTLRKATATDSKTLAQKNKTLAHSYRDKLARAICDYHEVNPNRAERDRLVKLVQGIKLW